MTTAERQLLEARAAGVRRELELLEQALGGAAAPSPPLAAPVALRSRARPRVVKPKLPSATERGQVQSATKRRVDEFLEKQPNLVRR